MRVAPSSSPMGLFQVVGVLAGLKAHEIVCKKTGEELPGPGEDAEDLGGRERTMQKEACLAFPAELSEGVAEREEVVVVDPDEVIGAEQSV